MTHTIFNHIGGFGVLSAVGICLALALLLAYHLKLREIRGRGRRLLEIELRLESAWQNVSGAQAQAGLAGVFEGGLHTAVKRRVLSMRPLGVGAATAESASSKEESIQQSELSCDI